MLLFTSPIQFVMSCKLHLVHRCNNQAVDFAHALSSCSMTCCCRYAHALSYLVSWCGGIALLHSSSTWVHEVTGVVAAQWRLHGHSLCLVPAPWGGTGRFPKVQQHCFGWQTNANWIWPLREDSDQWGSVRLFMTLDLVQFCNITLSPQSSRCILLWRFDLWQASCLFVVNQFFISERTVMFAELVVEVARDALWCREGVSSRMQLRRHR